MAIDFDGVDDYVSIPDSATMDVTGTFSAACWARADALPSAGTTRSLFGRWDDIAANQGGFDIRFQNVGGTQSIRGEELNGGSSAEALWTTTLTTGQWYHFCIVDDGTNFILYVDGINRASSARVSGGIAIGDIPTYIGAWRYNATSIQFFDGQIEDARLYDRDLTSEEVSFLAAGFRGPLGGEVGWWSCDNFRGVAHPDGTTLTAATNYLRDESGNGNTGDPIGGVIARASDTPQFRVWVS